MSTSFCKCGDSSVTLEPVGEDLWAASLWNATGKNRRRLRYYDCNTCGAWVDFADPAMIASETNAKTKATP